MPLQISNVTEPINLQSGEEATEDSIAITPDPGIELDGGSLAETIVELAGDIHEINNLTSLSLNYQMQRDS